MYRMFDLDRDFFDDVLLDEIEQNKCKHEPIVIDGHYTCILCGEVDVTRSVFHESLQKSIYRSYYIYHRKSYFREKLRLLSGIKQPMNDEYNNIINTIKNHNFETIFELKKVMRKLNLATYYKYIYHIYFVIKNVKLIPLTLIEIDYLINKFLVVERIFKQKYPEKSNLLSYNIVIYILLKKYYYEYHSYIILPKNQRKLLKIIEDLIK